MNLCPDQRTSLFEARRSGVAEAEGETIIPFRWKLEGETKWRNGVLVARPDYAAQSIGQVELLNGEWPTRHTLAVERKSSQYHSTPPYQIGCNNLMKNVSDDE